MEVILAKYYDKNLMKTNHKNPPSALIYRNIEGFFALYYIGCAAAFVAFLCEVLYFNVKERRKRSLQVEIISWKSRHVR